jgi:hypothetical protein
MSSLSKNLSLDPFSPKGNLGDFAHAARLFTDADLKFSPKLKFQYHAVIDINGGALINKGFKLKHANELNMLVKSCELPQFQIKTDTINQYNRKKIIQTKIDYSEVTIKFHDDSFGVTKELWQNYYSYYFADSLSAKIPGSYSSSNSTKSAKLTIAKYGLDTITTEPFFNSITIYQLSRGSWTGYKFINPMITRWSHDQLDNSANAPVENSMVIAYEAVLYESGAISNDNPPGFGDTHYDTVRSPLVLSQSGSRTTNVSQMSPRLQQVAPQPTVLADESATVDFDRGDRSINRGVSLNTSAGPRLGGLRNTIFPGYER